MSEKDLENQNQGPNNQNPLSSDLDDKTSDKSSASPAAEIEPLQTDEPPKNTEKIPPVVDNDPNLRRGPKTPPGTPPLSDNSGTAESSKSPSIDISEDESSRSAVEICSSETPESPKDVDIIPPVDGNNPRRLKGPRTPSNTPPPDDNSLSAGPSNLPGIDHSGNEASNPDSDVEFLGIMAKAKSKSPIAVIDLETESSESPKDDEIISPVGGNNPSLPLGPEAPSNITPPDSLNAGPSKSSAIDHSRDESSSSDSDVVFLGIRKPNPVAETDLVADSSNRQNNPYVGIDYHHYFTSNRYRSAFEAALRRFQLMHRFIGRRIDEPNDVLEWLPAVPMFRVPRLNFEEFKTEFGAYGTEDHYKIFNESLDRIDNDGPHFKRSNDPSTSNERPTHKIFYDPPASPDDIRDSPLSPEGNVNSSIVSKSHSSGFIGDANFPPNLIFRGEGMSPRYTPVSPPYDTETVESEVLTNVKNQGENLGQTTKPSTSESRQESGTCEQQSTRPSDIQTGTGSSAGSSALKSTSLQTDYSFKQKHFEDITDDSTSNSSQDYARKSLPEQAASESSENQLESEIDSMNIDEDNGAYLGSSTDQQDASEGYLHSKETLEESSARSLESQEDVVETDRRSRQPRHREDREQEEDPEDVSPRKRRRQDETKQE